MVFLEYEHLGWSDLKASVIGLGTGFRGGITKDSSKVIEAALDLGITLIDTAEIYGDGLSEKIVGEVIKERREQVVLVTKVSGDHLRYDEVLKSAEGSLRRLDTDFIDLYLVHWPFPNYHAPGCDINSRSPNAKPYIHENYMETWNQMESLVAKGLVRHIGTSNTTIPKLRLLLRDANIKPACNEMELHPHFQQPELFNYCLRNSIQPIGFCPIGSPTRPDRDKTDADTVDIEDPVILEITRRLNVHAAVICVKWAVQRGQIPIPFSIHRNEYFGNLESTFKDPLADEEMEELSQIDKNCRLIKGDVFLWKNDQTWEALWDPNGEITPP